MEGGNKLGTKSKSRQHTHPSTKMDAVQVEEMMGLAQTHAAALEDEMMGHSRGIADVLVRSKARHGSRDAMCALAGCCVWLCHCVCQREACCVWRVSLCHCVCGREKGRMLVAGLTGPRGCLRPKNEALFLGC